MNHEAKSTKSDTHPTKTVQIEVRETFSRTITVEVPIDAFEQDDDLAYVIANIPSDSWDDPEDVGVSVVDIDGTPEYRADKQENRWHVTPLRYSTRPRQLLARLHGQLVKSHKDDELEFNRITVEFPNEHIAPGCIYYRPGYAVVITVVASDDEDYRTGILRGFDRCFPSVTETSSILWDAVDELDESEQTGTWDLLERAAKWLAELEPEERAERQFFVPGSTITHPKPCRAVDAGELYYRFHRKDVNEPV
jgi:hypothetical protein